MEFLCYSANDKRVVFDPLNSHTASHFHDAPSLRGLAADALSMTPLEGNIIGRDVDMGKVVGASDVV